MQRLTDKHSDGTPFIPNVVLQTAGMEAVAKKLAEYEDLDDNGLLLRLHCKVGQTVYIAVKDNKVVEKLEVRSIEIFPDIDKSIRYWCKIDKHTGDWFFHDEDYGKIVFKTEKEAKEALEKMLNEEKEYTEEEEANDILDLVFLNGMIHDLYAKDIKEIFKEDFDIETKQLTFNNKKYQCYFEELRCTEVNEIERI